MNKSPLVENEEAFSSCGLLTLKLLPQELIAIQQEISDLRQQDPLEKMKKRDVIEVARKLRRDEQHWRRKALDNQDLLSRRERASEALAEELAREQKEREDTEAELSSVKAKLEREQRIVDSNRATAEKNLGVYLKQQSRFQGRKAALKKEQGDREDAEAELSSVKADYEKDMKEYRKFRESTESTRLMLKEMAVRCEQQQDFIDSMVGYQSFEDWVSLQQKEEEDCESSESD